MAHADVRVDANRLRVAKPGTAKFVERVDEITFSGRRALAAGKRVFYATHVGLFRLTKRGVQLEGVMPGIDVRRDILNATPMQIVLPRSGRVPTLPRALFDAARWAEPARLARSRRWRAEA
jgi:acyl CoA:acetate/3-ketoacid CoA transferase